MKRRPRVLPDPSQLVVVPAGGGEAIRFERTAERLAIRGAWTGVGEGERPPAATVVVLAPGRTLCRNIDLPDASESQLETALRLQLEALQLGSVPAYRTGTAVLPAELSTDGRIGIGVEWPMAEPAPATARDLPPDGEPLFAGDVSCLMALLHAGLEGPLVVSSEDRKVLSFAFRSPRGVVVRSSRLDPSEWPGGAEAAVLESALRAGANEPQLRALLERLRAAMHSGAEGGLGCTDADLERLSEISGIAEEPDWWRVHGLCVGAAMAWFGPLRALVSLRAQPKGERPSRVGAWLNRLSDPMLATRLLVAALVAIAVGPPLIQGSRLLLLRWKVGDLVAREQANLAHRQRVSLYGELQRRAWPMSKLLGDLACVTPEGVEWEDVNLSQDRNVSIQGFARPHDTMNGNEVLLKMERQMRDSRIFDRVQRKWEAPDGKGTVRFQISAAVTRPTQRPNYSTEQDFGKKSLAERRYGPEKQEESEPKTEVASGPPDAASLPPETALGESAGATDSSTPAAGEEAHGAKPAPVGKRAGGVSTKPSAKPVKSEPKTVADGTGSGAAAEGDGAGDGEGKAARATRRGGSGSVSSGGLARRSERNPGSSDGEYKAPEPLSDAAIAAMTIEEVKTTLSKVSEARQRVPKDDAPTQARLKSEFNKLMARLKGGGG